MMKTGLLFSGQGAQVVGMGRDFFDKSAIVREYFDRANSVLDFDLKTVCFEGPESVLTETRYCQPALYVLGFALFQFLREAGKLEDLEVVLGLSLGELTALATAEVFDFETGLKIVAERGRLMQESCEKTEGGMVSLIGGSLEEGTVLAAECDIDIGNINCPGQVVLSGEKEKVELAAKKAEALNFKRAIVLNVAGAYHSRLMESARKNFEDFLEPFSFQTPKIRVLTNVTGGFIADPNDIKTALVKQVVSTVRWEECMRTASGLDIETFYECGPNKILSGLARRTDKNIHVQQIEL